MNNKLKNPYFYLAVIGVIFSASGVDFNQLTSWELLRGALISMVSVICILPSMFMVFDKLIMKSSLKDKKKNNHIEQEAVSL